MQDATRQNRFLSPRSIWWLYIVLLIVGIAYGSAFVHAAFVSWSDYFYPPTSVGFGPFRLDTPFHLAMFSARTSAEMLLIGAVVALFLSRRRLSAYLVLLSVVVVVPCATLHVVRSVQEFGGPWSHAIDWITTVDAVWVVLMSVAAVALLRSSPDDLSKPIQS